jgi:hypothetical protein
MLQVSHSGKKGPAMKKISSAFVRMRQLTIIFAWTIERPKFINSNIDEILWIYMVRHVAFVQDLVLEGVGGVHIETIEEFDRVG